MSWFRNARVRYKLASAFFIMLASSATLGWLLVGKLTSVHDASNELGTIWAPTLRVTGAMMIDLERFRVFELLYVSAPSAELRHTAEQLVDTAMAQIPKDWAVYEPLITEDVERLNFPIIKDKWNEVAASQKTVRALVQAGKTPEALEAVWKEKPLLDEMRRLTQTLIQANSDGAERSSKVASQVYTSAQEMAFVLVGACLLLGIVLAWILTRALERPLIQTVAVLEAVADRDLTPRLSIDQTDEPGQMAAALNSTLDAIQTALTDVRSVADEVAGASAQLSAAAVEISSGAQEQAASLEETAASLEEITSTVKQNADNALQANQLAGASRLVAEKGCQAVENTIKAMAEIASSSKQIADIIATIDEIAFQTNLLALNAAVEAARAGEQGRGFAVVAAEVRNLAQRSASAAKEIKGLIQDSVVKVDNGSRQVIESGRMLEQIVTSVKQVTDVVAEIASASREQTIGISQVNQAVTQMDSVTQANAAQTEELSATAESLSSRAEQLLSLVGAFRLDADGRVKSREVKAAARKPLAKRKPVIAPRRGAIAIAVREPVPPAAHANGVNGKAVDSFEEF